MSNENTPNKITIVLFVIILTVFVIAIYSLITIRIAGQNIVSIYNDRVLPLEQLKNVSDAYVFNFEICIQKAVNGITKWNSALLELEYAKRKINSNWTAYLKTYLTPEEKVNIDQVCLLKAKADNQLDDVIKVLKKGESSDNIELVKLISNKNLYQNIELFTNKIDDLIIIQTHEAKNLKTLTVRVFYRIIFLFIIIIALCIMFIWLFRLKQNTEKKVIDQALELTEKNEELFALNEEFEANNEELDASNEELYSANIELESLNEQLVYHKIQLEEVLNERTDELKRSELLYKGIFENANDAIVILKAGVYVDCNEKALEIFGSSRMDFLGKTPADFSSETQPDGLNSIEKAQYIINKALDDENQRFEWKHIQLLTNKEFYVEISLNKIELNNEILIQAIIRDITERKREEDALRLSEEKFSKAFNSSPVSITITRHSDSTVIECNESLERLIGYSRNEFIGKKTIELDLWVDFEERQKIIEEINLNGQIKNKEVQFRIKNGTIITTNVSAETINYNGELCLLSVFEDITERKKYEESLFILKRSIDTAPDGAYWIDTDGRFEYVNQAGYECLGYSQSEFMKLRIFDIVANFSPELWEQVWIKLRKIGSYTSQTIHRRKNGEEFPVEITSTYILINGKEYCNGFAKDITDRKKTENALKASEERLQYLLDTVTDYIYSVKIEKGNVTETIHGEGCKTVTGYANFDFAVDGQLWINIVPEEDRHLIIKQALNIFKEDFAEPVEHRIVHKNGNIRWIRNSPVLKHSKEGKLIGYEGLITDITERKLIEEELRSNEELYRQVTTLSGYMVYDLNPDDNSIRWNGDVQRVTGFTNSEFSNANLDTWVTMLHPDDKENVLNTINMAIKNEVSYYDEYRFKIKSGEYIWIDDIGFKIQNKNKAGYRIIGIMKDVSGRKKLEQQILNGVIETEERERMSFSQELHDGLGPLISAIKMYVQLLSMPDSKMDSKIIIEKAESLIDESSRTVREISFKLSPHILQNYGIIEALNTYIEKVKESKKIEIAFTYSNVSRYFEMTETIIYRIICECFNNTIKHANASKIDLKMECENNLLEVFYGDNGTGFNIQQIVNNHKGIGLLNMQSRIKSINGTMNIESKSGNGTKLNFKVKI